MSSTFEEQLSKYADLIVRVGLNLQPGQNLLVTGVGSSVEAAPLVRAAAESAYRAGANYVDVFWSDQYLLQSRLRYASAESLNYVPAWRLKALMEYAEQDAALLAVFAEDPTLLADENPDHMAVQRRAVSEALKPFNDYRRKGTINWTGAAGVIPGWAKQVFPDLPPDDAVAKLWQTVFEVCRINEADPIAAWQSHIGRIMARRQYLNAKQYDALHFTGPGTDLKVGLVANHRWLGGQGETTQGILHTPNLPTEETFTMPHCERVDGVVTASKPLSVSGTLIREFSMTFVDGVVQNVTANQGESILRKLTEFDEGAARLGEVALVPHSSPISQSGILFYNTLFDENAANHIAIGAAYAESVENGTKLSKEELRAIGGNDSMIHVDFMIGSAEMNVDGILADDSAEPVMRNGEWAFDVM